MHHTSSIIVIHHHHHPSLSLETSMTSKDIPSRNPTKKLDALVLKQAHSQQANLILQHLRRSTNQIDRSVGGQPIRRSETFGTKSATRTGLVTTSLESLILIRSSRLILRRPSGICSSPAHSPARRGSPSWSIPGHGVTQPPSP